MQPFSCYCRLRIISRLLCPTTALLVIESLAGISLNALIIIIVIVVIIVFQFETPHQQDFLLVDFRESLLTVFDCS
jgi:hypothetical protein